MSEWLPEVYLWLGIAAGLLAGIVLARLARAVARAVWGRQ